MNNRKRSVSIYHEEEAHTISEKEAEEEDPEQEDESQYKDEEKEKLLEFYRRFVRFRGCMDILDIVPDGESLLDYIEENEERNDYFVHCLETGKNVWKILKEHQYWDQDPSMMKHIGYLMDCICNTDEPDMCEVFLRILDKDLAIVTSVMNKRYHLDEALVKDEQEKQEQYEEEINKKKKKRTLVLEDNN